MGEYAIYPSLKGRCVFITGGATGIGAAMVEAFALQGAVVAFVDLDGDSADALCSRLRTKRAPAFGFSKLMSLMYPLYKTLFGRRLKSWAHCRR